jgi:hypothetical protein
MRINRVNTGNLDIGAEILGHQKPADMRKDVPLVPASPAIQAAAQQKNNENYNQKRSGIHVSLL